MASRESYLLVASNSLVGISTSLDRPKSPSSSTLPSLEDDHDAPTVVAFVEFKTSVAEDNVADEKEALEIYISGRLPRFMYPSLIAHRPVLPTSTSGKINRRDLMELDLAPFHDTHLDVGLPQSDVEVTLHKIFSEILRTEPSHLGVTHDLFSVGLNSLLAVAVGENFKLNIGLSNVYLRSVSLVVFSLPLAIDFDGPTIRELSNVIECCGSRSETKKGVLPHMYIVHNITGMASPFMRLGAYMPNEMWAIGDKYFGSVDGFTTIEEMADHYITLIRSVQPHGPYVISGHSMGGLVALVIADKLESLKSSDWTDRAIDRISQNFPEIGEKWKAKLPMEIRKNLDAKWTCQRL
ncbi:hypothetical protein BJ322DRAFT_1161221 [Thelephora terrestris]|uniref:Carrier domain-containing protein n=1 Tax=Thelephora terrestris TaxID=56493 RepID=A0A9P6H861_9AGAM|nr:hypothetical protein BJ322DRAFT_1161221 [Thelephora terrestris]